MISRYPDQQFLVSPSPRHETTHDPALRGASLAFKLKPALTSQMGPETTNGSSGALAAALRAGDGTKLRQENRKGDKAPFLTEVPETTSIKAGRDAFARKYSNSLDAGGPSHVTQTDRQKSPSLIAANAAAARSSAATAAHNYRNAGVKPPRDFKPSKTSAQVQNDESSIPATGKLVELFEAKERAKSPAGNVGPRQGIRIVSPTPIRPSLNTLAHQISATPPLKGFDETVGQTKSPTQEQRNESRRLLQNPISKLSQTPAQRTMSDEKLQRTPLRFGKHGAVVEGGSPANSVAVRVGNPNKAPQLPPRKTDITLAKQRDTLALGVNDGTESDSSSDSSVASFSSAKEALSRSSTFHQKPSQPMQPSKKLTGTSRDKGISSPTMAPQTKTIDHLQDHPTARGRSLPPQYPSRPISTLSANRLTVESLKPQLTADSLADAMVASSIASSRAPSPTKPRSIPPPPPPPRRSQKPHSFSFLTASSPSSRAPSPLKSMRQTLRPPPSSSSDDDSKGRRPGEHSHNIFKRKHPNKHAEGDRKRWRDTITEVERKRYEGVWAANRGAAVAIEGTGPDEVHGLVVKDVWQRSGLPVTTLEEIWELVVGYGKRGSDRRVLCKEEFVVGIWLIDQCLKGRKLPHEVGPSIWDSARRLMSGITTR